MQAILGGMAETSQLPRGATSTRSCSPRELPGCRLRLGHVGYRFIRSAALSLPQPQRSFAFAVPASQTILSKTITFEMKALTFRMCFNPQLLAIALKSSFK
jgi:hypothetical protein